MRINYVTNRVIDQNGISDGASLYLYQAGNTTLVNLYTDPDFDFPIGNPYVAAAGAAIPALYTDYVGQVRLKIIPDNGGNIEDYDPYDPLDIGNTLVKPVIQTDDYLHAIDLWNTNGLTNATVGHITIRFQNGLELDGITPANIAGIYGVSSASDPSTAGGLLFFQTRTTGTGLFTDRMVLDGPALSFRPVTDNNIDFGVAGTRWKTGYFYTLNATTAITTAGTLTVTGAAALNGGVTTTNISATGAIGTSSPTIGMGYGTGAGGAVTQITNKATATPAINKMCGTVTMNNAALAAGAKVAFVVTNNVVAATDTIIVNVASGGTANAYRASVTAIAAATGFTVTVENITAGSLSEAPVINFAILRGVSA